MIVFSIIVPVYNGEKYLAEAINSVIDQTYTQWELILVDDGSIDGSSDLIKEYLKDVRIKYIYQQNAGPASARNRGIKNSSGDFICFLDADDFWKKEKLAMQYQLLKQKPEVDLLYSLTSNFYQDNSRIVDNHWYTGQFSGRNFFGLLLASNAVTPSTTALKKSVFEKTGLFDEDPQLIGSEDFDMWLKIAFNGFCVYGMPERNTYYRIHGSGIHHQKIKQVTGKVIAYEKYRNIVTATEQLQIIRQYRYLYRELLVEIYNNGNLVEYKLQLNRFFELDKAGWATGIQKVMIGFMTIPIFHYVSLKVLYRIAYRMENFLYKRKGLLKNNTMLWSY